MFLALIGNLFLLPTGKGMNLQKDFIYDEINAAKHTDPGALLPSSG